MQMTKEERVATVVSIIVLLLGLCTGELGGVVLALLVCLCYWGIKFIKNDISFININDKK